MKRKYAGDPLDLTWQDFKDRPYKGKGETVDATPDDAGSVRTEGVGDALDRLQQDVLFDDVDEWTGTIRDWDFTWRQELLDDRDLPILIRLCVMTSLMADMNEYGAQVDLDIWHTNAHELNVEYLRLHGEMPFGERQYVGDRAMHDAYGEYITEILPQRSPDPLDSPLG